MRATILSLSVLLGLTGCATEVTGEGGVVAVEKAALERDVHFLDLAEGGRPLEASEARTAFAVPVVLRFHEDVAIAWLAPEGTPEISREGFVAFWPVAGHASDLGARDGTLAQPSRTPVQDPEEPIEVDTSSPFEAPELPGTLGDLRELSLVDVELPIALVDWLHIQTELEELPPNYHPGCL